MRILPCLVSHLNEPVSKGVEGIANDQDAHDDDTGKREQQFVLDDFFKGSWMAERARSRPHEGQDGADSDALVTRGFSDRQSAEDIRVHRHTDDGGDEDRKGILLSEDRVMMFSGSNYDRRANADTDQDVQPDLMDDFLDLITGKQQAVSRGQLKFFVSISLLAKTNGSTYCSMFSLLIRDRR
jgi:hypothetical protein